MKNNVFPLQPENFYHIYNCGINGGRIFFEEQNFHYLIKLISEKVKPVAKIYSYCFMENHFHMLVKIRSEKDIRNHFPNKVEVDIEKIISQQFSNTFNSYSQAINKRFARTGKLFELPFRRRDISTKKQLMNCILYINKNPVKHNFPGDLYCYPYSSIHDILRRNSIFIESSEVMDLFENEDNFKEAILNYRV